LDKNSNSENVLPYSVNVGVTSNFDLTFSPTAVQAYNGDVVITHNAGGGDEIIAVTGNGISGLPLPYEEDFEEGGVMPYAWINDTGDDFDWTVNSGGTPSSNTGPSGDHTTGSGYYVYTESTNPNFPNKIAYLLTPQFDLSSLTSIEMKFWYHMYGDAMGSLHIDVYHNDAWINDVIPAISGNQGNSWYEMVADISAYAGETIKIRFRGITGSSYTSDMAIDDFWIGEGAGSPSIVVNPLNFNEILVIDANADEIMQISNTGNAELNYNCNINYITKSSGFKSILNLGTIVEHNETSTTADFSPYKPIGFTPPDVAGDILIDFDVETPTGDNQILGCEFDGTYIWTTGGGAGGANKLYKFDISGNLIDNYDQGTSTDWGMRDMVFDGTNLYAGDEDGFYKIDPSNGNVTTQFTGNLGLGCIRALAYNSTNGHFYCCNWTTEIVEFDATGTQYGTLNNPGLTNVYGLAYDERTNRLWIHDRSGNPETSFYEYDIATQSLTGVSYQVPLLTNSTDQMNGGAFFATDLVSGKVVLGGIAQGTPVDRFFAMELDDVVTYTWLSITNNGTGIVPPNGGSIDVTVHFDATGLNIGTYNAEIIINSNDPVNPVKIVPVTLEVISSISLDIKVFLEGPYLGTEMYRFLNTYGYLPLSQPYNTSPWYYTGTESVAVMPNLNIVDWVLIELRETPGDASTASASTMIAQQAAFILIDGTIVGMDGSIEPEFQLTITENLYAVIWHRNHLGVLSANALTLNGGTYSYDFTTGSGQVYGGSLGHKNLGGVYGMIGADGNSDGQISVQDKNDIWAVEVGNSGYYNGDFDMNGNVSNEDKVDLWNPNSGSGSQVLDNIPKDGFKCQVPK